MDKKILLLGGAIGSTLGGWLPQVFGASWLSVWGILGGGAGGLAGIWLAYKISNY